MHVVLSCPVSYFIRNYFIRNLLFILFYFDITPEVALTRSCLQLDAHRVDKRCLGNDINPVSAAGCKEGPTFPHFKGFRPSAPLSSPLLHLSIHPAPSREHGCSEMKRIVGAGNVDKRWVNGTTSRSGKCERIELRFTAMAWTHVSPGARVGGRGSHLLLSAARRRKKSRMRPLCQTSSAPRRAALGWINAHPLLLMMENPPACSRVYTIFCLRGDCHLPPHGQMQNCDHLKDFILIFGTKDFFKMQ